MPSPRLVSGRLCLYSRLCRPFTDYQALLGSLWKFWWNCMQPWKSIVSRIAWRCLWLFVSHHKYLASVPSNRSQFALKSLIFRFSGALAIWIHCSAPDDILQNQQLPWSSLRLGQSLNRLKAILRAPLTQVARFLWERFHRHHFEVLKGSWMTHSCFLFECSLKD